MKKIINIGLILIIAGAVLYLAGMLLENYANNMVATPKVTPTDPQPTLEK